MRFEYLLCLLFIISSASSVSDVRMKLKKEFINKPNSLRFETTMSSSVQSMININYLSIGCGVYEACVKKGNESDIV